MVAKKERVLFIAISTFLLMMTVGYAMFSEDLVIGGTASTTNNLNVDILSTEITEVGSTNAKATISSDKNTLTLSAPDLQYPGANVEYIVTIKNTGALAAKLKAITKSFDNGIIKIDYVDIAENEIIAVGDIKTFKVIVTWDSESQLSSTINYSIDLAFEQAI